MQNTLQNSWALVKASARILNEDRALLLFPLMSGLAFLAIMATFVFPAIFLGGVEALFGQTPALGIALAFVLYLVQYFIAFFFNAALVGAALIHLDGGRPTVQDGLQIASDHVKPILGYALISATVGLFLNSAGRRSQRGGRLVSGVLGTAWNLATFLAVPVLVTRDVGPIDALRESARLLKGTWGEQLSGMLGMGIAFGAMGTALAAASLGLVGLVAGLGPFGLVPVLLFLFVFWVLFALATTALQGIYRAAVYRYALTGEAGEGFESISMRDMADLANVR